MMVRWKVLLVVTYEKLISIFQNFKKSVPANMSTVKINVSAAPDFLFMGECSHYFFFNIVTRFADTATSNVHVAPVKGFRDKTYCF